MKKILIPSICSALILIIGILFLTKAFLTRENEQNEITNLRTKENLSRENQLFLQRGIQQPFKKESPRKKNIPISTSDATPLATGGSTEETNNFIFPEKQLVDSARETLRKKGIPEENRVASIEHVGGKAIVTFLPKREEGKPLPRAGRHVVTLDESTGEIIDIKVWR